MYKIFKINIIGLDTSDDTLGINPTVRATMGYSESTKQITVLVEKIIFPEVPTTESVDLRGEHTTVTYETLLEKTFTPEDFPKTRGSIRWVVDYDVANNKIVGPFDALEYTKTRATSTTSHRLIPRIVKERYTTDLIPLFTIDNFYKAAADFDASIMTVYLDNQGIEFNDTVLTGDLTTAEEVIQAGATTWQYKNLHTNVHYEILDNDGKIMSTILPYTKDSAKAAITYPMIVPAELIQSAEENPHTSPIGGNRFKVQLPAAEYYNVRASFDTHYPNKTIPVEFGVTCVNGVPNKTRLVAGGYDKDRFAAGDETNQNIINYRNQHDQTGSNRTLNGVDSLRISTNGLVAGDFIKLKLNIGEFYSYSELWIEIV